MKCMICGGQTLPGAKLCLPCRSALRRARDDTVSELLPLPRRREAFAFSHSPAIGRGAPLAPKLDRVEAPRTLHLTRAQRNAAAVVVFVTLAGLLAYRFFPVAPRDRVAPPAAAAAKPSPPAAVPQVSPTALLGAAREEGRPVDAPAADAATALADTALPVLERKADRGPRSRASGTRPAPLVEPLPPAVPVEAPAAVASAPEPPVPAVAVPAVERPMTLAASLAQCSGGFFERVACEQRTRARFCDGKWGQTAQCPAGVANEHGQ